MKSIIVAWVSLSSFSSLCAATPAEGSDTVISADPGSVVRWWAPGTERCFAGDRSWAPIDDTCYYPIDLAQTAGIDIGRTREGVEDRATIEISDYPYPVQHVEVEQSYVTLSQENLARSRRERARIAALWSRAGERRFSLPLEPPLAELPEARNFGSRRVFNGEPRNPHSGADYSAPPGTPVLATADGKVALAEEHFFGGKSVFVDHGDGLISMYLHLSEIEVEAEATVKAGDEIGKVGASGRVSGPHLHFGLRWRRSRIDPTVLMAAP